MCVRRFTVKGCFKFGFWLFRSFINSFFVIVFNYVICYTAQYRLLVSCCMLLSVFIFCLFNINICPITHLVFCEVEMLMLSSFVIFVRFFNLNPRPCAAFYSVPNVGGWSVGPRAVQPLINLDLAEKTGVLRSTRGGSR